MWTKIETLLPYCHAYGIDQPLAEKLAQQFETDISNAKKIDLIEWQNRPKYKKLLEQILHLFSSLM